MADVILIERQTANRAGIVEVAKTTHIVALSFMLWHAAREKITRKSRPVLILPCRETMKKTVYKIFDIKRFPSL